MTDALLDTCIVIDLLRGKQRAISLVERLPARPGLSVITVAEVIAGARSQREELRARAFFFDCRVLPVTPDVAERAGSWVRHWRASHGLDLPDALIAATAEHHGLELMTLNVKHFPMIEGLERAY